MHVLTWETVESSGGDHADTLESFSSGRLSMLEEEGRDVCLLQGGGWRISVCSFS